MASVTTVEALNYIAGRWERPRASDALAVRNPATAETIGRVPLSSRDEVDAVVRAAQRRARHGGARRRPTASSRSSS